MIGVILSVVVATASACDQVIAAKGESCGGYTRCPVQCADGMMCQDKVPEDPWAPQMSDRPGICCPQLTCACVEGSEHRVDDTGCLTCDCKETPCGGERPIMVEGTYKPLFCGRGPSRVACPESSECHIAANDAFAVCCPTPVETTTTSTEVPDMDEENKGGMPGGSSDADANDEDVQAAAKCGMQGINARANSLFQQVVVDIQSASQQVVAGIKYVIRMSAAESSACRNDGNQKTLEECPPDGARTAYEVTVVVAPWMPEPCSMLDFTVLPDSVISTLAVQHPDTTEAGTVGDDIIIDDLGGDLGKSDFPPNTTIGCSYKCLPELMKVYCKGHGHGHSDSSRSSSSKSHSKSHSKSKSKSHSKSHSKSKSKSHSKSQSKSHSKEMTTPSPEAIAAAQALSDEAKAHCCHTLTHSKGWSHHLRNHWVGLVIGGGVASLLICVIIFILVRRRRRASALFTAVPTGEKAATVQTMDGGSLKVLSFDNPLYNEMPAPTDKGKSVSLA